MKVIVPCCGRSTRYPNQPPKWMLPSHDGRPMIATAISQLGITSDDLVVTILREHEDAFNVTSGLTTALGAGTQVLVLDEPTRSQAETIARTLEILKLDEPFLIKDSDNVFALDDIEQPNNYVCVDSLNNYDSINPRNKSYLQTDHQGIVTNIREKVVISDLFNVGGYFFLNPAHFLDYHHRLAASKADWQKELYISDIIGAMILDGIPFRARPISSYQDWGTIHEWKQALMNRRTFFVSLDGFLFERGSRFFRPSFEEVRPNADAINAVKTVADRGNTIIYLSVRPLEMAELTRLQMLDAALPEGQVIYDCPISSWRMITSSHSSLPFSTSQALELSPEDPNLLEKMLGDR